MLETYLLSNVEVFYYNTLPQMNFVFQFCLYNLFTFEISYKLRMIYNLHIPFLN